MKESLRINLFLNLPGKERKVWRATPDDADATLKGIIQKIRTRTISRVGTQVASEREVVMTLDLRLIKQNGEIIWTAKGLSGRQAFDVSDQKLENDRNETLAIAILSERIAQRIFSRLTDDF